MNPAPDASQGELELGRNGQATARALLAAAAVGAALMPLFLLACGADRANAVGFGLFGAIAGAGAAFTVVWLRQPRGARITWDDWGVTEWDGDGVRAAIPWSEVRVGLRAIQMQAGGGGPLADAVAGAVLERKELGGAIGGHLVLTDGGNRRIDVCQGVQSITLNDRLTSTGNLKPLVDRVRGLPRIEVTLPGETLKVLGWLPGIAGYFGAAVGLAVLIQKGEPFPEALLVPLAALVLVLNGLPSLVRARRLGRAGRGAREVVLEGGSASSVELSDGLSGKRTVELATLKHPDGRLAERRGRAWVVDGAGGAVESIEAEGARQARRQRRRAMLLEAALRLSLALAVLAPWAVSALRNAPDLLPGADTAVELMRLPSFGQAIALEPRAGLALIDDIGPRLIALPSGADGVRLELARGCSNALGAISPDGSHALIVCGGRDAALWALSPPRELARLAHPDSLNAVAFLSANTAVTADFMGRIRLWTVPGGQQSLELPPHKISGVLKQLVVSPTMRQLALLDAEGGVWTWAPQEGVLPVRLHAGKALGEALAYSPDGAVLAASYRPGSIGFWDAETGKELWELSVDGHQQAVALSPDGRLAAIAIDRTTVVFVDVKERRMLDETRVRWREGLSLVEQDVSSLAFSGAGHVLALTSRGGLVMLRVPSR